MKSRGCGKHIPVVVVMGGGGKAEKGGTHTHTSNQNGKLLWVSVVMIAEQ